MPRTRERTSVCILALAWASIELVGPVEAGPPVSLELLASGFSAPIQVTHAGDGSGRLFVVEQAGRIRIIDGTTVRPTPFLDITSIVVSGGEQGLLGLAFHPDYETNGFFYVNYTDLAGNTAVSRYSVSPDPNRADAASGVRLLAVNQPFGNHNGGQLQFSPLDGYLYIGMGDGGSGNDPFGHGQNRDTLLGAMLRIDVDGGFPYAIPPTNPYVGVAGADEIWAIGLRNPWRFSFDRETGDLYLGDVGQAAWEEIDFQAAGTAGGLNFGWALREGPCPLGQVQSCPAAAAHLTDPIAFYGRSEGKSVTGGFVYRGIRNPGLVGRYFYGDFISGRIWSVHKIGTNPDRFSAPELRLETGFFVSSFGESEEGELYVVDYFGGRVLRLREILAPPVIIDDELPEGRLGLPYSEAVPVVGGSPPLSFVLVSGSLAPGLVGPHPTTGVVSGTPAQAGTFGPFVVRVTDSTGLFDEEALIHTITLAPPEPLSPLGATNQTRPAFAWSAPLGATSYRLVVDNVTDGAGVIDQSGIATTSFTPAADLASGKLYDWRVQATDGTHPSPFSANVRFEVDVLAPGAVTTLAGTTPGAVAALPDLSAVSVSAELPPHVKGRTVDGDLSTLWSTPPRFPMVEEQITLDLGAEKLVSRVRLRSRDTLGSLLPRDFEIQMSHDGSVFSTVHSVLDFSAPNSPAAWYAFDFPPALGRFLRLSVTETTQHTDGKHYVQVNEIEVWSAVSPGTIAVSWLAPGDDGAIGTASSYDIRYRVGNGPTLDFDSAVEAPGEPAPRPAGSTESYLLSGLDPETSYEVALKSHDDAGNVSGVSNTAIVVSSGSPPAPVADLAASPASDTAILLSWTATGDDGSLGTAAGYDVRLSTVPIDGSSFSSATEVSGEPAPLASGAPQSMTVGSLAPDTVYYFAMKVRDDVGNASLTSSIASAATLDLVPPDPVTDLAVSRSFVPVPRAAVAVDASGELPPHVKERLTDGDTITLWSTPARSTMQVEHVTFDLGASIDVMRIRLRSRDLLGNLMPRDFEVQLGESVQGPFTTALSVDEFAAPVSPAGWFDFDFPPARGRFLRLLVTGTNEVSGSFYVQMNEVEVFEARNQGDRALLSWSATGDNGSLGTAASYDLRYGTDEPFDFDAATPLPGEPVPKPSGLLESYTAVGIPGESTITFGIRVCDEARNCSSLSNLPGVTTPPIAPGPIANLAARNPTGTSIEVAFTAPGDDGLSGTAAAYDLRYRTGAPITTEADFAAATQVPDEPAPAPGGSAHAIVVSGLTPETTYHFAMKVVDDVGALSPLSSPASATTLDVVAPGAITNLVASLGFTTTLHAATVIDSSGELAPHVASRLVDGRLDTLWSTPPRPLMQDEHVTFDLGAATLVGRVRLRSRDTLGNLLPRDFQIQLGDLPSGPFTTVATVDDFSASASPAAWYAFEFAPAAGRYLRIRATETNAVGGFFYVQMTEVEIHRAIIQGDHALLTWTATGDNGQAGTAAYFDLRYAAAGPFDFDSATEVASEPAPALAGSLHSFTVLGLPGESTVRFGIKSCDEVDNCSPLSNVPSVVTPPIPPGRVTNLAAGNSTGTSIRLTFTAPGDDGSSGTATAYDVRYRTGGPIVTEADYAGATEVPNEPQPHAGGSLQEVVVADLTPETTYHFALKAVDDVGAFSPLSNPASAATLDVTAPGPIADLAASPGVLTSPTSATPIDSSGELAPHVIGRLVDKSFSTLWSTPGRTVMQNEHVTFDLGSTMLVGRVSLRSREALGNLMPRDFEIQLGEAPAGPFAAAAAVRDFSAPASPAGWFHFDFAPASGRYLRLDVTETNAVGGLFYVQIVEVEVHRATLLADRALLTWTAPGDNGAAGTAARYDVRHRKGGPITSDADFDAATPVPGVPVPRAAGSRESFVVTNLQPEAEYAFAINTLDEAGNSSGLSNVPSLTTPPVPPARVTTLVAGNPTATSIRLDWVATGDDGAAGTASTHDVRFDTTPIASDAEFDNATEASMEPAPAVSGTPQFMVVDGLSSDTTYFFAMKVEDDVGARSSLSNVVSAKTLDVVAPATVTDLAASAGFTLQRRGAVVTSSSGELPPHVAARAADGDLATLWSTPGRAAMQHEEIVLDLGASFSVARLRLRSRDFLGNLTPRDFQIQLGPSAGGPFVTAAVIEDFVAAVSPAAWYDFDFPPALGRFVRVLVTETSSVSGLFYVQVNEIEVYSAVTRNDRVTLTWTAPGDNETDGSASVYDVRYGTAPFVFATAAQASGEPVPRPAGAVEIFTVTGLAPNTTYHFALQALDEAGQASGVSNVVTFTTPP